MLWAGVGPLGRLSMRLASLGAPPLYGRAYLARLSRRGYVSPSAKIHHSQLRLGSNVFVGPGVLIYEDRNGGPVELGDAVRIYDDSFIQTGDGGGVRIGSDTVIQPRCQISAYKADVEIGAGVIIAPNCALYPYDHGIAPGVPIRRQPLQSKGPIVIGDGAWLGVGAIVLSGVRIGEGSVIGAGSVVTEDVPDGAIAVGSPARVINNRAALASTTTEAAPEDYPSPVRTAG